jgi:hypothetical protein
MRARRLASLLALSKFHFLIAKMKVSQVRVIHPSGWIGSELPLSQFELRDPGLPPPTLLTDDELKELMGAAVA